MSAYTTAGLAFFILGLLMLGVAYWILVVAHKHLDRAKAHLLEARHRVDDADALLDKVERLNGGAS